MAIANNTIQTRIQLKSDTEANWERVGLTFIPLDGEMIIYSPDATHDYTRAKIGDGHTAVGSLPFLDAGTINGDESFVLKYANFDAFPSPGATDKLYIDLSTALIYYYSATNGYTQLMSLSLTRTTVHDVVHWGPGTMTNASVTNGILTIRNGVAPQLLTQNVQVVTNITGGAST